MDTPGGVCDYCGADEGRCWDDCPTVKIKQQADEIERLRDALKPFAEIADDYETLDDEDYVSVHRHDIELRHFRAIRAALQQKDSE